MSICVPAPTIVIDGMEIDIVQTTDPIKKTGQMAWVTAQAEDPMLVTNGFSDLYQDEPTVTAGSASAGYKTPTDLDPSQIPAEDRDAILYPATVPVTPTEEVVIHGKLDYSLKLSRAVILRDITLAPVAEPNSYIRSQAGRSENDIVNNLKALSVQCIDPILSQFPGAIITSGFRQGASRSQHCRGQAVDLQWEPALPASTQSQLSLTIATWILTNIPFDQMILERSVRTGKYWIHVSFNKDGNRANTNRAKFGTMTGGANYVWGKLFV